MQAKNLSGVNFDEVKKKILYDNTEIVRMSNDKDPRAKFINVPIPFYDEMEFIFQDKHATGEFTVLQTPYDYPSTQDADLVGDKNPNPEQEGNNGGSLSGKRPNAGKADKGKRVKRDDSVITEVTHVLRDMTDTMRFTCEPSK